MQDQQGPNGWTPIQDAYRCANVIIFLARVFAAPVEVILRTRFGRNYFGFPAAIGILFLPMWMIFFPYEDPRPLLGFWGLVFIMQIRARIEGLILANRNTVIHSRYNGWPRLSVIFRKAPEHKLKGYEAFLVLFSGICCLGWNDPLAGYLVAASISLFICSGVIEANRRAQVQQMQDAWIEQQDLMERFREMQRGRRR